MADAKVTDLTELSVPALEDVMYIVDDPSGTPASRKVVGNRLMGMLPVVPGGRLTLTSGTSVTTSDVTGAGTLYYTPDVHNLIRLYDGTRWKLHTFTERSLALTLTASRAYDVFIYDNAGTLTLELSAAWNSDGTTRTDALTTQDGVKVKSGAATRLWLGTIYASASNQTEDSITKRYVWNKYNKAPRRLARSNAVSHAYNSTTVRPWNNDATQSLAFVAGEAGVFTGAIDGTDVNGGGQLSLSLNSSSTVGSGMVANYFASTVMLLGAATSIDTRVGFNEVFVVEGSLSGSTSANYVRYRASAEISA
jgi:hypothetical protein